MKIFRDKSIIEQSKVDISNGKIEEEGISITVMTRKEIDAVEVLLSKKEIKQALLEFEEETELIERKIFCKGCSLFMGVIRDANLRKGISYLCTKCETKRIASDLANKIKPSNPLDDFVKKFTGL